MVVHICSSHDGAQVAVLRDHEVALFTTSPLTEVARAPVDGVSGTIAFCGKQLLIHTVDGDRTVLTVLSPPKLGMVAQLELSMATVLLAVSHGYALLGGATGAVVAQCSATTAAVAALRLPATFDWAVGLETPGFMTWGSRGAEIWDAAARRPSARIALNLPGEVHAVGTCSQHRSVWIAGAGHELLVSRMSDGRTIPIRLPGPPRRVAGHPSSSWLIADIDGVPHAINVVMRTCDRLELPLDDARALVPSSKSDSEAQMILVVGDQVVAAPMSGHPDGAAAELVPAAPPAAVAAPHPPPTPPPIMVNLSTPEAPARSAITLTTSHLGALPSSESTAGAPRPMTVSERLAERSGRTRAPAAAAPAPPAPAPAPETRPSLPPRPPETTAPRPASAAASGWRSTLLDWYRGAVSAPDAPLPDLTGAPLAELARRGLLGGAAVRIVHALYASWLDGDGERGVSVALLAELGAGGEPASAWSEALGTGRLAGLGMVTSEHGRTRLVASMGTFLDGRRPRSVELIGRDAPPDLPGGLFRIAALAGETPRACAERLARGLGQIAYCEADGQGVRAARQWAEQARFEAWLRRRPTITAIDLGAVVPRDGETVLLVVSGAAADLPGGPPWWRDAAS